MRFTSSPSVFAPFWSVGCAVRMAVLGLSALAPTMATAQSIAWTQYQPASPTPSPRNSHAMAYDSARGVTVLFGGYAADGFSGETWEWNGTIWTQRTVTGPSPRVHHTMVYDVIRGVTVLFGGAGQDSTALGDTWEWNGISWSQRAISGPSPRVDHAMAYDSARGVAVLFGGGTSAGYRNETWEWDGIDWAVRAINGPPLREYHAMAYDSTRRVTVLFGGYNGHTGGHGEGDTWEWDGTTWTERVVSGPSPRYGHAMAYDAARGVTILFGGEREGTYHDETWEWDGSAWIRHAISGPSPRFVRAMVYDTTRFTTVLFGGFYGEVSYGDTWGLGMPIAITQQPTDQSVTADAPATFVVIAQGRLGCATPLRYQWQRRNPLVAEADPAAWIGLADSSTFLNTAGSALVINHPLPSLATGFRCRIASDCSPFVVYTDTVNFSVACPADFNADGGVDGLDVEAFFERWENGC